MQLPHVHLFYPRYTFLTEKAKRLLNRQAELPKFRLLSSHLKEKGEIRLENLEQILFFLLFLKIIFIIGCVVSLLLLAGFL